MYSMCTAVFIRSRLREVIIYFPKLQDLYFIYVFMNDKSGIPIHK